MTQSAGLRAFIDIAPDHPFSIYNLPFGVFSEAHDSALRIGVAIGDYVLDLDCLQQANLFAQLSIASGFFRQGELNPLMAWPRASVRQLRQRLIDLLQHDCPTLRDDTTLRDNALIPMSRVRMHMPASVAGFTDFYASKEHATNMGCLFRDKNNPLLPNWLHMPVAYDGRASGVVVSGTDFVRPHGQLRPDPEALPHVGASQALDVEVEMGFFVGQPNRPGSPIHVDQASEHVFGMVLLNDWSARDIQKWEYVPLGPFLGKNFCTSISPWVVTLDALESFRTQGPVQDPAPLSYLQRKQHWALDIKLELWLQTPSMSEPQRLTHMDFKDLYWDLGQQLAHHSVNGCHMRTADLLASGTVSSAGEGRCGSLIELTQGGREPITLDSGEQRCFLQDGDKIMIRGYCQGDGYRVGFGEVMGSVLPAVTEVSAMAAATIKD